MTPSGHVSPRGPTSIVGGGPTPADRDVETEELAPKLLLIAAIRVLVVTLALGILFVRAWYDPPDRATDVQTWHYVLIGTVYALSLVYAALLRIRRLILPLVYAQVGLDALVVSVLVLMTGGVESVFAFTYVFSVLGASLTLYRRGGLISAAFTILMYGTILVLQLDRTLAVLPAVDTAQALVSYFVHSLGVLLVAVLAVMLAERARATRQELRERESDLEQLQELHAAILRSLPAGLMTVDGRGIVRYVNEAAKGILRVESSDVVGRPLHEVVPPMSAMWRHAFEQSFSERRERFEEPHTRPDGTMIRVGFSFAPLAVLQDGLPSSIVVFQDVTDIVRLKEAVQRAERLATVGKFAAGLAHEVRNPLASMCASIDVLQASLQIPPPMERLMGNVMKEAERLNALISDFLAFSRPRKLELEDADLGELVEGVLSMFENEELMRTCRIERRLSLGVRASVDEDLVRQVIWNLIRNAGEAMHPDGGDLALETAMKDGAPVLEVHDSGPGIPPERLGRIFDPFYTTKERGSGLGLAITHSIVEAHGAEMSVDSVPGKGTRVSIRFRRDLSGLSVPVPQNTNPGRVEPATDELEALQGGPG